MVKKKSWELRHKINCVGPKSILLVSNKKIKADIKIKRKIQDKTKNMLKS